MTIHEYHIMEYCIRDMEPLYKVPLILNFDIYHPINRKTFFVTEYLKLISVSRNGEKIP